MESIIINPLAAKIVAMRPRKKNLHIFRMYRLGVSVSRMIASDAWRQNRKQASVFSTYVSHRNKSTGYRSLRARLFSSRRATTYYVRGSLPLGELPLATCAAL